MLPLKGLAHHLHLVMVVKKSKLVCRYFLGVRIIYDFYFYNNSQNSMIVNTRGYVSVSDLSFLVVLHNDVKSFYL